MLGMIAYLIACGVAAMILTVVLAMIRPIKRMDDFLSWRVMAWMFLLTVFAPYGYIEFLTYQFGKEMSSVVLEVMQQTSDSDEVRYYKVLKYTENTARVIAVGEEPTGWGGTERPLIAMTLRREDGEWIADEYNFVVSDKRGFDSSTLPPYW